MKFFSVFSGIGLFDLGLETAGWQCVGQCEIEPFPAAVLEYHWPDVWRYDDVRKLTGKLIREHCGDVDAIIGGPPCQPASVAGRRKGSADDRWLWPDYLRLVSEVKPVWVLAENPGGVLSLHVDGVRFSEWIASQFKDLGYTLLPILLGAADVGAPHERERVWFMAHSASARLSRSGRREESGSLWHEGWWQELSGRGAVMGDSDGARLQEYTGQRCNAREKRPTFVRTSWPMGQGLDQYEWEAPRLIESQSALGTAVDGRDRRMAGYWRREAVKAVGNAVVPQIPQILAEAINEYERRMI